MVSTSSRAGWPAWSMALRTAAMLEVTPVEVSLWTTQTALMACPLSSASRAPIASGSAPVRQSPLMNSGSRPRRRAMRSHRVANQPVSYMTTLSPGERVLTRAASQAPGPDAGLFFPVEPSTASRCTFGGMAGNNSCGARSIRYGKMVDNVLAIDALLPDGERFSFGRVDNVGGGIGGSERVRALASRMLSLADRERAEIETRFPKVQRRVGGYNLDSLVE